MQRRALLVRLAYGATACAIIGIAVLLVARTIQHSAEPVYRLTPPALLTVIVAAALCVASSVLLVFSHRPDVLLLVAVGVLLFLAGVASILSIGILLLVVAAGVLVLAVRRSRGSSRSEVARNASVGLVLGVAVLVVFLVSSQPPLVECLPNGVETNSRSWWGGSPSGGSGSGSGSADGVMRGEVTLGDETHGYECAGGRLLRFE